MTYPSCSLIVSTYNWKEALELVLLSVLNQSILPNEVLIADDGSREDTKILITKFQEKFPIPLIHIWQEDNGFQKSKILNKTISHSKFDYIIQIDGDIIVHKNFVQDHLTHSKKNQYIFGSRVNIKKTFLPKLFKNKITTFNFFSKGIKKRFRTIRIPFYSNFVKQSKTVSPKIRGCNLSFWKKDFIKINGYNERFKGWGGEDYEMCCRLFNNGVLGKRLKFAGVIFHIYHPEADRSKVSINTQIQSESVEKKLLFATDGIDKYLN
jgi:glycosyltransferase involved in cell wall biosynthesis